MSGLIQRESFDASKDYKGILWFADLKPQEFSFNEMEAIFDLERQRLAGSVWKDAGIAAGFQTSLPGSGVLGVADGLVHLRGRLHPVAGASLQYADPKSEGIDVVYVKWLLDQVTRTQDPLLYAPAIGDSIEERLRVRATLATANPDVLDEGFDLWTYGSSTPPNWTLASGACGKGYPAKHGETGLKLIHTSGVETRVERVLALIPETGYSVYYWVRTADGQSNLALGDGAYVDLQRSSPAWNPTDNGFETTAKYVRHGFTVTADASSEPVTLRVVIPATAPSTEVLIDAILVTTETLAALDLDRHHYPLLFWDRATDEITRAVPRPSNLRMQDLEPPLDGRDIVNLDLNPGFLDYTAALTYDEHGHYRVPPGLGITADASLDASGKIGLRVGSGRAYVRGYRVLKPLSTGLQIDKALTTAAVADEGHSHVFGSNFVALNKAAGGAPLPIKEVDAATAVIEAVLTISRGNTPDTMDDLGVVNVVEIKSASQGTPGSVTGSTTGPFAFTESNNTLKVTVTNYDGSAGTEQTLVFNRGSYTIAEVVAALMRGSGRAYRSGKIVGNVVFENDGSGHLRIKTKTQSSSSTVAVGAGGTANSLLGLSTTPNSGTGTHYAQTTSWLQSGNSIDWSPGGAEPSGGTSYTVVARRTVTLAPTDDYVLGGLYASELDRYYKVTAWGPDGEGEPSAAVHLIVPIGGIVQLSWASVANAVSYHIYRSDDGGTTYNFLLNTTAISVRLDGSMTPDSSVHPPTFPSTTTGRAGTQLDGAVSQGATSITVDDTTGFPSSGTAFIDGSEQFTYANTTGTTFTGIPANGAGAIDAAHLDNAHVTQGPGMGALTIALANTGVLNLNPQGNEPVDGSVINVDYDYYLPRTDRITLSRAGTIAALPGIPSETPVPPSLPVELLELGQVKVYANSATCLIVNSATIDRPTVADLRLALQRIETLYVNDISQQVLNQVSLKSTAAKKGLFADAMSDLSQQDVYHPDYEGLIEQVFMWGSVAPTVTPQALAVNGGATTAALVGTTQYWLPSTEITLVDQPQWSEVMNVNPYASFAPPPARITLTPDSQRWSVNGGSLNEWQQAAQMATLVIAGAQTRIAHAIAAQRYAPAPGHPNWVTMQEVPDLEKLIETARAIITQSMAMATGGARAVDMSAIQVLVEGVNYGPAEDNIALTFAGVARTATPVSPGTAGTNPGTVKADAVGRWAATITIPTGIAAGVHDVRGLGPVSDASAAFTGIQFIVPKPPPLPPPPTDPVSQSFNPTEPWTLSAIDLYFTAKDATIPITVMVRSMAGGFPGDEVLAQVVLAPSQVNVNGTATKVSFVPYLTIPAGTSFCISLITPSNAYYVQTATLGKAGRNPAAWITSNPLAMGTLFASGDAKTWTAFQASDLRCKVYGRQFSASAVLEFSSVSDDFSDLWLGADVVVPDGGPTLTWEYEINGDGIPHPWEPGDKTPMATAGTSVLFRAKLGTGSNRLSPSIMLPTVTLLAYLNALSGTLVWRLVEFTQALTTADVYVYQALPSGTTVTWYVSNDDGTTWDQATLQGSPVAIDSEWAEYHYAATFTDDQKSDFRVKVVLTATTPLVIPRIAHLGVTLQ